MNKRGQIWVETVIYTLIGIAIIGIVLSLAKPKIEQKKNEIAIEQAIDSLSKINSKIIEVQTIPGNRRVINLKIGKGELIINSEKDKLSWEILSNFEYSEEGIPIPIGEINITTINEGGAWKVILERSYSLDLRYSGSTTEERRFGPAPTPYSIVIENDGKTNRKVIINIREA